MRLDTLLQTYSYKEDALLEYGFENNGDVYTYESTIEKGQLFLRVEVSAKSFQVQVCDSDLQEPYMPFEIESLQGAFVSEVRERVEEQIQRILTACFVKTALREQLFQYVKDTYDITPQYPWAKDASSAVLKTKHKGKWFALLMRIPAKRLGLSLQQNVEVMNVKVSSATMASCIDHHHFFPAYHMNKKYWMSVLLDKQISMETLTALLRESYQLVEG